MLLQSPDLRQITDLQQQLDQQENLSADASRSLVSLLQAHACLLITRALSCSGHGCAALGLVFL